MVRLQFKIIVLSKYLKNKKHTKTNKQTKLRSKNVTYEMCLGTGVLYKDGMVYRLTEVKSQQGQDLQTTILKDSSTERTWYRKIR